MNITISEIFGPTFQGEGPSAGRRAMFVRLGGCNLSCSWCDTPYTWDASRFDLRKELHTLDVAEVAAQIRGDSLVVITGGEPLLQARAIQALLDNLDTQRSVEIETNGTLPHPGWMDVRYNVSPKLAHSGRASKLHPSWLEAQNAIFKFVVRDVRDLDEVAPYGIPAEKIWIMPEGTGATSGLARAREIADAVLDRGWNLTLRQHVLLWNNERGR